VPLAPVQLGGAEVVAPSAAALGRRLAHGGSPLRRGAAAGGVLRSFPGARLLPRRHYTGLGALPIGRDQPHGGGHRR
jgi:hypothetical protein